MARLSVQVSFVYIKHNKIFTEPRGDWLKTSVEKKPIEQQTSLASDTACLAMLGYIKLLLRNAKTQVDAKLKIW